ncbi:glycerophosphoryl diester phosphodiesterase membrane domain-containing protein [Gemella cuniculi]|uniref:glycerophosphoryl diester phosphodiesterase membrane domain-containing protein n=1 Tax=Gemella cuniculi TaxID=150240 RepID=UPI00041702A4|nr:glycerophosphodiester phosphodiesterase [Gemella cuniculi]
MNLSIKELFSSIWHNISKNKFTYISIAVFLQLFILSGLWVISIVFQLALKFSGEEHLDKNNFWHIFFNPISFVVFILLILFAAFLMFIEFSTLTFTIYGQLTNNKYSIRNIASNAWSKMKNLIGIQILFFIGYFILTIPVANLGVKSLISKNLYIPKFITGELTKTPNGLIVFILLISLLAYINFRLVYTLPLTVVGDKKLIDNIKTSWDLTKKGKLKFLITIGLFEFIYGIISLIVLFSTTAFFALIDSKGNNLLIQTLFFTIASSIIFFFSVLSKVTVITALITILIKENQISEKLINHKVEDKKKSRILLVFSITVVLGTTLYNSALLYTNGLNKNIMTIAHRGYVAQGVENSIESLEAAAKAGVNYVEVDILLTKDNKFVVMHDYNLKRLAGINKRVQDMNYDEVVGLPISQGDHKSKIPSFDEFVKKAKELNVKLLVELKPHGSEPNNYIDLLINKIKELGIENEYKYMSLDLKVIEQLESKAPHLNTGYVIPLQFGKFSNNNVDFFVIEDFSYRESLVEQAKSQGKQVYVWTVNDYAQINKYLQSPVDAIITDEPEIVKDEKNELENNKSYFDKASRLLTGN